MNRASLKKLKKELMDFDEDHREGLYSGKNTRDRTHLKLTHLNGKAIILLIDALLEESDPSAIDASDETIRAAAITAAVKWGRALSNDELSLIININEGLNRYLDFSPPLEKAHAKMVAMAKMALGARPPGEDSEQS